MPLIDYANPAGSQGLQQLAGPFGSLLGPGASFPASYDYAKRFVNNSTTAEGSGGNGVTALDDPTYLGFQLMFDPFSPLFAGAGIGSPGIGNDALPGSGGSGNLGSLASQFGIPNPGDETAGVGYDKSANAIGYLNKIGEGTRAKYLQAFVQGIQEINRTRPYYWQTIEGLDEAWGKATDFKLDPYTGSAPGAGITIGCLEAIDLKLTALFSLYKMAVYDVQYKRCILPPNLMKFDVYVYIQEIRKFKTVRNWLTTFNPSKNGEDTANFTNENTSQVGFKFTDCTWDMAATGKVFETVTNSGGTIATTSIKFGYSNIEQQSQFSGFDGALKDWTLQQSSAKLGSRVKKFAKDQVNNIAAGAVNQAQRTVSSAIQGITLGNVFGARNEIFAAIQNPQALANAAVGAAVQAGEGLGESLINLFRDGVDKIGNAFDQPTAAGSIISQTVGDNIFADATNPPDGPASGPDLGGNIFAAGAGGPSLESTNVFGDTPPGNNSDISGENIFS
jgi:hypothetical protein